MIENMNTIKYIVRLFFTIAGWVVAVPIYALNTLFLIIPVIVLFIANAYYWSHDADDELISLRDVINNYSIIKP